MKKQKALREERLSLMKRKVKEEFGRDLDIKYDDHVVDDTDEELLALEADQVKDQKDLPGKDLTVSRWKHRKYVVLNFRKYLICLNPKAEIRVLYRWTNWLQYLRKMPYSVLDFQSFQNPSILGDVKKKITEYEDTRNALQKRNNLQREKQEIALQVG